MLCTVRVPGIYFEISFVAAHQPLQGTAEKVSYDRSTVYSLCLFVNVAIMAWFRYQIYLPDFTKRKEDSYHIKMSAHA
jgi:hypothetical protein